jgi:predicted DNA-binding protein
MTKRDEPGADLAEIFAGPLTYVNAEQSDEELLAQLPSEPQSLEQTFVTSSFRLPYPLHQRLRAYADEHQVSVSTLLRQWVEMHLNAGDKPISLDAALRALAALPEAA